MAEETEDSECPRGGARYMSELSPDERAAVIATQGVGFVRGAPGYRQVERLDDSKPPPGYSVDEQNDGWWWWVGDPEDGNTVPLGIELEALADAWAHYKARHDPPGMVIAHIWGGGFAWGPRVDSNEVAFDEHGATADDDAARAAAWAWYDRRLALAGRLGDLDGVTNWPAALNWSDEQVAEVERWLVDLGDLPEVLRA